MWGQFIDFVRINVISPNEQAMIAFLQAKLEAKEINVQTYIKYAAELSQIVKQGPQPLLRDVVAGLRTAAAASQEVHAIPFAPEDLVKIIHTPFLPAHVRTALYLCFKTGSRWDEIAHLTRGERDDPQLSRIIHQLPRGDQGKSTGPLQAGYESPGGRRAGIPAVCSGLPPAAARSTQLSPWSTAQIDKALRAFPPSRSWIAQHKDCRQFYTAHSAKRTAAGLLCLKASQGLIAVQQVQRVL